MQSLPSLVMRLAALAGPAGSRLVRLMYRMGRNAQPSRRHAERPGDGDGAVF